MSTPPLPYYSKPSNYSGLEIRKPESKIKPGWFWKRLSGKKVLINDFLKSQAVRHTYSTHVFSCEYCEVVWNYCKIIVKFHLLWSFAYLLWKHHSTKFLLRCFKKFKIKGKPIIKKLLQFFCIHSLWKWFPWKRKNYL